MVVDGDWRSRLEALRDEIRERADGYSERLIDAEWVLRELAALLAAPAAPVPQLSRNHDNPALKDEDPALLSALAYVEGVLPGWRHTEAVAECVHCNVNYIVTWARKQLEPPAAPEVR